MKPFWKSRTLWANAIALVALGLQEAFGHEVLPLEIQGTILGLLNIVLRFATTTPIEPPLPSPTP